MRAAEKAAEDRHGVVEAHRDRAGHWHACCVDCRRSEAAPLLSAALAGQAAHRRSERARVRRLHDYQARARG